MLSKANILNQIKAPVTEVKSHSGHQQNLIPHECTSALRDMNTLDVV